MHNSQATQTALGKGRLALEEDVSNRRATKRSVWALASLVVLACACGDGESSTEPGPGSERDDPAGRPCTLVACFSDFPIELEQNAAWPLGNYEVSVSVDGGEPESCVIELGEAAPTTSRADDCATETFTVAYTTGDRLLLTSNRVISRLGSALETAAPAIHRVHVERGEHVELVVTGPGGIVSQGSFAPAWGEYFSPNGFECGPNCRNAAPQTAAVELPAAFNE